MIRRIAILLLLTTLAQAAVPALFKSVGTETNGAWHLPIEVRQALRKADGNFVLATMDDSEERRGLIDKTTWIPTDDVLKQHGLLPEAQYIDASGRAWIVGHGAGLPAVCIDGQSKTNVFKATTHFQGLVEEDAKGRIWLSERGGVHLVQGDTSLWLSTASDNKTVKGKGRFHQLISPPNGQILVVPRSIYTPRIRHEAEEPGGFAHLYSNDKSAKPTKVELTWSAVQQALPQPGGSWYFQPEGVRGREPWLWSSPDVEPPAELQASLKSLGAEDFKERRAASKTIKEKYRRFEAFLETYRLQVEDPEIRLALNTIIKGWEAAEAFGAELPEIEERFPLWVTADYLRTPDREHSWMTVLLAHREDRPTTYQAPYCALIKVDKEGSYSVVATDIPITARPGRLLSEHNVGYDLIPLEDGRLLYRDKQGIPCIIADGKALRLPDLLLPGMWPIPETVLLDYVDGDLMLKQRDLIWWVPDVASRLKKTEATVTIDPTKFLADRMIERTANEINNLQTTGGKPETIKGLLDKLIVGNPHRQEGYNARMLNNLNARKPLSVILPDFQLMLALEPEEAFDYWRNGQVLNDARANRRAIRAYGAAIRLRPIDPRFAESRADLQARFGMTQAAIADYALAIEANPRNLLTRLKRAEALADLEQYDEALEQVADVLEMNDKYAQAYSQRATIHARMDLNKKSLADHDKSIELEPENALFYMRRGNFRVFRQMPVQQAKKDFEKALEIAPDNPEVKNNLAWMMATYPDDSIRDGKRAVKLAMEASEAFEHKMAYIVDTLAACYAEIGDFANAIKWQQHAISMARPDDDMSEYMSHLEAFLLGVPVREPDVD